MISSSLMHQHGSENNTEHLSYGLKGSMNCYWPGNFGAQSKARREQLPDKAVWKKYDIRILAFPGIKRIVPAAAVRLWCFNQCIAISA